MNNDITAKNFGTKLSGVIRSTKTATANLQSLLVFAGQDYLTDGDSGYLKKIVNACVGVQSLATNKMIGYIVESSDLKCVSVEIKSGKNAGKKERVFKREKSGTDTPRSFSLPAYAWNQWERADEDKKTFEVDTSIGNLIKRVTSELQGLKGVKLQHTLKQLVSLKALVGDDSLTSVPPVKKAA